MKRHVVSLSFLLFFLMPLAAQEKNDVFSIYLVRHAEKDAQSQNAGDPNLSEAGTLRAEKLAHIFENTDISRIYSTNYTRTISTAKPVATNKKLEIELYNAQDLNKFCALLLSRKEDALVVGHSNTTSVLAGLLAGKVLPPMDDSAYDLIYIVTVFGDTAKIQIIKQGI